MKLLAPIGFILLLPACSDASFEAPAQTSTVASAIDAVLTEASSTGSGYAIIVELDGEIILRKGYGYANRARRTAFTPESVAQIGSLTKQFNATAILQLVDASVVELAAPIKKYIPEIAPVAGEITLHQLLSHSSGLPEYCGDDFKPVSRENFIQSCLTLPLLFDPGTDTAYSNIGYGAIAAIVEFVSGQKFETYLDNAVLRPNGLEATGHLFPAGSDVVFARGYLDGRDMGNIADQIRALGNDWWNLKGNGGMQASTLDMYAWYKSLNGEGTLKQGVRAQLTTPHLPWLEGIAEGYGWYFRSDDSGHVRQMSHSGSDGVFFSYYWHRLDEHAFMYFVGNSGEEPTKNVLREVLRILTSSFDNAQ